MHSFTCKEHHACLSFVNVHQMALPLTEASDIDQLTTHLSTRRDERLSWPGWLTYSGWLIHISGHPSATGRAQDSESSPAKDRRSTAVADVYDKWWSVLCVRLTCMISGVVACVSNKRSTTQLNLQWNKSSSGWYVPTVSLFVSSIYLLGVSNRLTSGCKIPLY